MTIMVTTKPASRAAMVQKVCSPGGIEAWLVEDYAVPLIAFDFAFRGGAAQDPAGKPGTGAMMTSLLDEGAGALDAEAFHQAMDDKAIEIAFSADRDFFSGRLKTLSKHIDAAIELLRLAPTEARLDLEEIARVSGQIGGRTE